MWCGGLGIALFLGGMRIAGVQAMGVGFAPPVQVAPIESGRLLALNVELHSRVSATDIVAQVDPVLVAAERNVASATLLATRDGLGIALATESRRFAESAEGSMLTRAQLSSSIREDEATLRTLHERLSIEQNLVGSGATAGLIADDVQWQIDVVEARLEASRGALYVANNAATNADTRNADAPGINEWEVVAAARAVELLDRRIELYDLTAGIDGHVTMIYAAPGSMVSEGLPILEVRKVSTKDVVAYVMTVDTFRLTPGEPAVVVRADGQRLDGRVVSVGGSSQMFPLSLWPYPQAPRFGVPVKIELTNGEIAPDEPVTVRM